jgi:hypothetical protein
LADETKQLGESYCNNGWQMNTTMLESLHNIKTKDFREIAINP